jgi:hypothetical protein
LVGKVFMTYFLLLVGLQGACHRVFALLTVLSRVRRDAASSFKRLT